MTREELLREAEKGMIENELRRKEEAVKTASVSTLLDDYAYCSKRWETSGTNEEARMYHTMMVIIKSEIIKRMEK